MDLVWYFLILDALDLKGVRSELVFLPEVLFAAAVSIVELFWWVSLLWRAAAGEAFVFR